MRLSVSLALCGACVGFVAACGQSNDTATGLGPEPTAAQDQSPTAQTPGTSGGMPVGEIGGMPVAPTTDGTPVATVTPPEPTAPPGSLPAVPLPIPVDPGSEMTPMVPDAPQDTPDDPDPPEPDPTDTADVPVVQAGCEVSPIPDELRESYDLDPFYTKHALAYGIPIVSSDDPVDLALSRVCELVRDMLSERPDVIDAIIDFGTIFSVVGEDELTNDIPEYSFLDDSINTRARGLGGADNGLCAEESVLCNEGSDRWRGEGICVHEYAHTIAGAGLFRADPTFQARLTDAYDNAIANGLFDNTYAQTNIMEYWAEGAQNWYNTNLQAVPSNGIHNEIDTRQELLEYDPALYSLLEELLPADNQFLDCYAD